MKNISEKELKELARQKKNEYQKQWYEEKKAQGIDKQKEYQDRYWRNKALEELKQDAQ